MLLTTFRRNGIGVSTARVDRSGQRRPVGMWTGAGTGKWKRMRNNPRVTIQACTARGKTRSTDPVLEGNARSSTRAPVR